ncbi:MAG: hypothetical protein AB7V46_22755 [Thermomicrobiales bacterium]
MWKYFKALWYCVTGRFKAAAEALNENKYVMSATYDNAIDKNQQRFETVKGAVAELIRIESDRTTEIKQLGEQVDRLTKVKQGAQAAMQKRIDALKGEGKSKEQILADGEFIRHKGAFDDASSTLQEKLDRMAEKEADLKERQKQIAQFKSELQRMQRANQALKEEKHEALADVAIAQQAEAIDGVLAGISSDSSDKDLQAAREARKRAQARAKVTSELAGNDAKLAENEYLSYATQTASTKELDGLLDWGEDTSDKKELDPAKLPE